MSETNYFGIEQGGEGSMAYSPDYPDLARWILQISSGLVHMSGFDFADEEVLRSFISVDTASVNIHADDLGRLKRPRVDRVVVPQSGKPG